MEMRHQAGEKDGREQITVISQNTASEGSVLQNNEEQRERSGNQGEGNQGTGKCNERNRRFHAGFEVI